MLATNEVTCWLCGASDAQHLIDIDARPSYETDLGIQDYHRTIYRCNHCDVYFNHHNYLDASFYTGDYNQLTYQHKLKATYDKIRALPAEKSDNKHRARRIADYLAQRGNG